MSPPPWDACSDALPRRARACAARAGLPYRGQRNPQGPMTDRIALFLAILIVAALAYDAVAHDWANTLFLARKGDALIEWLAFWR